MDATSVYWTAYPGTATVMKVPLSGGTPSTLAAGATGAYLDFPEGIAVDATDAYWLEQIGTVMKVPLDGGTPTTLSSGQLNLTSLAVDGTSVYWTSDLVAGAVMKLTPK